MDASRSPGFSGSKQRLTIIKNSQASAVFLAMVDDSACLPGGRALADLGPMHRRLLAACPHTNECGGV